MTNEQFKNKIYAMGIHLNGIFCGFDIVMNKKLELNIRMRKNPKKPNLKMGEIPVLEAVDITTPKPDGTPNDITIGIAKVSLETVLATYDIQPHEDKTQKVKEFDKQIKHQIELTKNAIIVESIREITPAKQLQLYALLGIKNGQQLIDGNDSTPKF